MKMGSVAISARPEMNRGRRKLSASPTTKTPQTAMKIAKPQLPLSRQVDRRQARQTRPVPTIGMSDATAARTPKTTGEGRPAIAKAMPTQDSLGESRQEGAEHDRLGHLREVVDEPGLARFVQGHEPRARRAMDSPVPEKEVKDEEHQRQPDDRARAPEEDEPAVRGGELEAPSARPSTIHSWSLGAGDGHSVRHPFDGSLAGPEPQTDLGARDPVALRRARSAADEVGACPAKATPTSATGTTMPSVTPTVIEQRREARTPAGASDRASIEGKRRNASRAAQRIGPRKGWKIRSSA